MELERRHKIVYDRRSAPTRALSIKSLLGRRRHIRRASDYSQHTSGYYVDWYASSLLYVSLATLLLCCTDAHLTLRLLSLGAQEINIFMDALIKANPFLFVSVKVALTSVALVVLVAHHNFRILGGLAVRHIIHGVFLMYLSLFAYELSLIYV